MNQQNTGITQSAELPQSYADEVHEFIQEESQVEEHIMFVGISTHQIQLEHGYNPLTVLGLCTSINNDLSVKRYKIEPTPTFIPTTIASLLELGLQEIYEGYNQVYPDHVIIYRNITNESELRHLQDGDGEIHLLKCVIREFYGERTIKFSYVAVVSNYSGTDKENLQVVPNGSFMLETSPVDQQQTNSLSSNSDLTPQRTTCLTLVTSSTDYDLNELVRLTTGICEYNSRVGTKPNILLSTTRFTNTLSRILMYKFGLANKVQEQGDNENNERGDDGQ